MAATARLADGRAWQWTAAERPSLAKMPLWPRRVPLLAARGDLVALETVPPEVAAVGRLVGAVRAREGLVTCVCPNVPFQQVLPGGLIGTHRTLEHLTRSCRLKDVSHEAPGTNTATREVPASSTAASQHLQRKNTVRRADGVVLVVEVVGVRAILVLTMVVVWGNDWDVMAWSSCQNLQW